MDLVYLDNNATTQPAPEVVAAMMPFKVVVPVLQPVQVPVTVILFTVVVPVALSVCPLDCTCACRSATPLMPASAGRTPAEPSSKC